MSWPLGYGKQDVTYRTRVGGVVLVNGVEVTAADGWIDVPSLPAALAQGAPVIVSVQLRARLDARGRTYLYAGAIRAGGHDYADASAIQANWAGAWLASLADGVHAAIGRCLQAASRASTVPARRVVSRPSHPEGYYALGGARALETSGVSPVRERGDT